MLVVVIVVVVVVVVVVVAVIIQALRPDGVKNRYVRLVGISLRASNTTSPMDAPGRDMSVAPGK